MPIVLPDICNTYMARGGCMHSRVNVFRLNFYRVWSSMTFEPPTHMHAPTYALLFLAILYTLQHETVVILLQTRSLGK